METEASDKDTTKPIRVFLLDDHEIVRRGVRDMLEAEGDIKVVGEAGTASSALARIPALRPDVAMPLISFRRVSRSSPAICGTGGVAAALLPSTRASHSALTAAVPSRPCPA